jgi:Zn-dependent protease with chaperone function
MKVCTRCGSHFEDTSIICSKCGQLLSKSEHALSVMNVTKTNLNRNIPVELKVENYALSTDLLISENIRKIPVLTKASETLIAYWSKPMEKAKIMGDGVKIQEGQLSSIYHLVKTAAERLQIKPPEVFIKYDPSYNAYTLGSNDDHIIVLHSSLVDDFTEEELLFIIGHEMGHIKSQHVTYQTIGRFINDGFGAFVGALFTPLKTAIDAWSREAEKTADRAGYLVTENPIDSIKALIMLALGSRKLLSEFNLEAYLLQREELENFYGKLNLWFGGYNHPYLVTRVYDLIEFMRSNVGISVKKSINARSERLGKYPQIQPVEDKHISSLPAPDSSPLFCPNCGFEIEDVHESGCFVCGTKVRR